METNDLFNIPDAKSVREKLKKKQEDEYPWSHETEEERKERKAFIIRALTKHIETGVGDYMIYDGLTHKKPQQTPVFQDPVWKEIAKMFIKKGWYVSYAFLYEDYWWTEFVCIYVDRDIADEKLRLGKFNTISFV